MSEHRSICLNTLMGTDMTGFSHAYERNSLLGRRRIDTAHAEIPCGRVDTADDFLQSCRSAVCELGSRRIYRSGWGRIDAWS